MKDGRIPKDILYGEMATGSRATGRPLLRYSDVCRRDLRETAIDEDLWEKVAADRGAWRQAVYDGLATLKEPRRKPLESRKGVIRHHRYNYRRHSYVKDAKGTATQGSGYTATASAAPQWTHKGAPIVLPDRKEPSIHGRAIQINIIITVTIRILVRKYH